MSVRNKEGYKYKNKINSMFGVYLPPRKKKINKSNYTLRFVLTGTLPSKKNQWIPATNFRGVRNKSDKSKTVLEVLAYISDNIKCYIRPNNKFKEWERKTKEILVEQAAHYSQVFKHFGICFPLSKCSIKVYCYWKENITRDNTNKLESIQDILTDSGIIVSDAWQYLNPVQVESEYYPDEILEDIVVIELTVLSEKTYTQLREDAIKDNIHKVEESKIIEKIVAVPLKDSTFGIDNSDLMALGWYEETYNYETEEEVQIDNTPHPKDWEESHLEYLKAEGYDLDVLRKYYGGLRWDD